MVEFVGTHSSIRSMNGLQVDKHTPPYSPVSLSSKYNNCDTLPFDLGEESGIIAESHRLTEKSGEVSQTIPELFPNETLLYI